MTYCCYCSYIKKCSQIQNSHTESVIVDWHLNISNNYYEVFLELIWEFGPVGIEQAIGHIFKTFSGLYSKVTEKK